MNTNLRQYVTRATTTTTTGFRGFLRYIVINSGKCYCKQGYFCGVFFPALLKQFCPVLNSPGSNKYVYVG